MKWTLVSGLNRILVSINGLGDVETELCVLKEICFALFIPLLNVSFQLHLYHLLALKQAVDFPLAKAAAA